MNLSLHQRINERTCSCGTLGWVSELACGHETWTHGEPTNIDRRGGAWISCHRCQGQRKILAVRRHVPAGYGENGTE